MKLSASFTLQEALTSEQIDFFHQNGLIRFKHFITPETVQLFLSELDHIGKKWMDAGMEKINGIPIKFGKDQHGNKMVQRYAFISQYSLLLHEFLQDPRLKILLGLLSPYEGRIGEYEKDGLVANYYINAPGTKFSQMGWHTDSARDIFLRERIKPMLNVGIHLDPCPYESGGLRAIPGTHKQNLFKLLFAKKYFVDHSPDPKEVGFDIEAGDLTVHDGRLWHRAQRSPYEGEQSLRRVMYVPVVTGKYKPKEENSKTPFYHRFAKRVQN
jgi:phytanoyl-CoA hydroxylase